MKDTYKIASLVAAMLVLSGCLCGGDETAPASGNTASGVQGETTSEDGSGQTAEASQGASATTLKGASVTATTVKAGVVSQALSDLSAAMKSGVGYKCVYNYNGVQTQTWVKGQKFATQTAVEGATSHMVSDGTWMYIWSEGQNEGMKMNLQQLKSMGQGSRPQGSEASDMNEVARSASNVQCSPDVTADSQFTPPSSVTFQDYGEMLKSLQGMQQGLPTRRGGPTG
jgi:hypothetical protein